MAQGYSNIFNAIVKNDDDFVGMVAYTLYKRQKIEWIKKFSDDHGGVPPTEDEVQAGFGTFSMMASQLESYKGQAIDLLDQFLDEALSSKVDEVSRQLRDDLIIKAVKKSTWVSIGENVIAGLLASLFTLGATGLAWVATQGPEKLIAESINKVVTKPAQEASESSAKPASR